MVNVILVFVSIVAIIFFLTDVPFRKLTNSVFSEKKEENLMERYNEWEETRKDLIKVVSFYKMILRTLSDYVDVIGEVSDENDESNQMKWSTVRFYELAIEIKRHDNKMRNIFTLEGVELLEFQKDIERYEEELTLIEKCMGLPEDVTSKRYETMKDRLLEMTEELEIRLGVDEND